MGAMGKTLALISLAALAVMGSIAPAHGQDVTHVCRLCSPSTSVEGERPATPLRIDVVTKLDFDRLVVAGNGGGSAELRPDGGRFATGAVANIGARAMVAEVLIHGEPGRFVRVDLPTAITLYGTAGGQIRVESVTSDLPAMARLDGNGTLQFRIGGNLKVEANLDGEFRGDVRIDVDYF
jgi:hypothetical protein